MGVSSNESPIEHASSDSGVVKAGENKSYLTASAPSSMPEGYREPGARVLGGLKIGRMLGEGTFSVVYEALGGDEPLAIKIGRDKSCWSGLEKEAKLCTEIRTPHMPEIFGHGFLHDGCPYVLMKLYDAPSVADLIAIERMRFDELFDVMEQLLDALTTIHIHGVIHCDVKPGNILLTETHGGSLLKLIDYGISEMVCDQYDSTDLIRGVTGTPPYMAPEQFQGSLVDKRTDVYAAGAVFYEMLTGRTPFVGIGVGDFARAVANDVVLPPSVVDHDLPRELDAVVLRALAKDASNRFSSALEMKSALQAARKKPQCASKLRSTRENKSAPTRQSLSLVFEAVHDAPTQPLRHVH